MKCERKEKRNVKEKREESGRGLERQAPAQNNMVPAERNLVEQSPTELK